MFRAAHITWQFSNRVILVLAIVLLVAAVNSAEKKHPPATPIDLNAATVKELEQLPGVGPTTAKAIVEFRTKSGRFHRVNDLLVIRGISEAKLKKMRPYVTIGPAPAASATPPTKKTVPPAAHPPAPASSTKPQPVASTSAPKPSPPAHPASSPTPPPAASKSPN